MSNDLNQCQFIGRLGKEVDSRFMPDGKAVANFSIAVGSQWKNKQGDKQESTEWINCVAYDKLGEICGQYLTKGSQVFISGSMKTRKWEKDGVTRYSTEIIVNNMQMIGGKRDDKQHEDQHSADPMLNKVKPEQKQNFDNFDSDSIPF